MSIVANLGVLAAFKYNNFFIDNVNALLSLGNIQVHTLPHIEIILPIGLSFHTFQAMSYTIEVYRGNQKAERHFGIYALYVMFYPQLVAGPIERPQNLLHQFYEKHFLEPSNVVDGLKRMLWGMFKKVVIADRLSLLTTTVFQNPHCYSASVLAISVISFSFQIYCDFSGYSDIALGASRVMGFKLMKNFDRPFSSRSISEFWRRWHISLSSWFNDYLFMPFVVAKREWGNFAIIGGLLITFFLSGLWHGAGWTFIIYGCLHGIAMSYEILTKAIRKKINSGIPGYIYHPFTTAITFLFVSFSFIFFRANTIADAQYIIRKIGGAFERIPQIFIGNELPSVHIPNILHFETTQQILLSVGLIIFLELIQYLHSRFDLISLIKKQNVVIRWMIYYASIIAVIRLGIWEEQQFIYFQF